ncbi:MAG: Stk1 family PASTA domain-containing Ser/Thr kinase [Actinomycetota bacterium]|nr:Stk1 family PASTA domain-containing Ser/Thr kinase [Actinomycetota bacterium]
MSRNPTRPGDSSPPIYNGRYELSHQIARGGTAQVYLARDLLLDRPVALKVLFPELSSDSSFVDRFRREAQAAANLSHPNIVPVFDWGESDRTYFIVMEYVDGEPLSAVIKSEAPLSPVRSAAVAADIAKALSYAHRHGVVHRDIKPGNVLLTRDGQVKVTDFGIARAIGADDNVTQTGLVMGTATYFSPEQAQGFGVDGRSDVYSLGVVLYEMVTGRPPFAADTPVAIAYKHVSETPVRPREIESRVPGALEAIILRAMAKHPGDRYATAEDLRADLQRFSQGSPVLAGAAAMATGGTLGAAATQMLSPATTTVLPGPMAGTPATAVEQRTEVAHGDGVPSEMPKRRWIPWVLAGLLLLAALGVLVYYGGRQLGYFGAKPSVREPDVIGSPLSQAEAILKQHGLRYQLNPEHSSKPKGVVIGQVPGPLTVVRSGSTVTLSYSAGLADIQVPSEFDVPYNTAETALKAKGFKVALVPVRPTSPNQTQGLVVRQSPSPGILRPPGSTVTLYYISGAQLVKVPTDLTGKTLPNAEAELYNAGLKVGATSQTQLSATVPKGDVVTTSPPPGTTEPVGTYINIIVSAGPGVTVPNVLNDTQPQAQAALSAKGFQVIVQYTTGSVAQQNTVISQTPTGGTQAAAGAPVTIVIDSGPTTTTTTSTTTTTTTSTTTLPTLPGHHQRHGRH